jgi:hypothetical protein
VGGREIARIEGEIVIGWPIEEVFAFVADERNRTTRASSGREDHGQADRARHPLSLKDKQRWPHAGTPAPAARPVDGDPVDGDRQLARVRPGSGWDGRPRRMALLDSREVGRWPVLARCEVLARKPGRQPVGIPRGRGLARLEDMHQPERLRPVSPGEAWRQPTL